eukprot:scaffold241_cov340-Pavlova_lutheri.AAC.18
MPPGGEGILVHVHLLRCADKTGKARMDRHDTGLSCAWSPPWTVLVLAPAGPRDGKRRGRADADAGREGTPSTAPLLPIGRAGWRKTTSDAAETRPRGGEPFPFSSAFFASTCPETHRKPIDRDRTDPRRFGFDWRKQSQASAVQSLSTGGPRTCGKRKGTKT